MIDREYATAGNRVWCIEATGIVAGTIRQVPPGPWQIVRVDWDVPSPGVGCASSMSELHPSLSSADEALHAMKLSAATRAIFNAECKVKDWGSRLEIARHTLELAQAELDTAWAHYAAMSGPQAPPVER